MAGENWVNIPDSDIDTDSAVTQALLTAFRDNLLAAFRGAAGAPKIGLNALPAQAGYLYLGDGSDGALNYTTTQNVASREFNCTSLDVKLGVTLGCTENTDGFLIYRCTGTATIDGSINLIGKGSIGGNGGFSTFG